MLDSDESSNDPFRASEKPIMIPQKTEVVEEKKHENLKEQIQEKVKQIEKSENYFSKKYEEQKKLSIEGRQKNNQLQPIGSPEPPSATTKEPIKEKKGFKDKFKNQMEVSRNLLQGSASGEEQKVTNYVKSPS